MATLMLEVGSPSLAVVGVDECSGTAMASPLSDEVLLNVFVVVKLLVTKAAVVFLDSAVALANKKGVCNG